MVPPQGTTEEHIIMAKKTIEPVVEQSENDMLLEKAAKLDALIKELTAELNPIKDRLKLDLPAGQTYAAGPYTAKLTTSKTFNGKAAAALYGHIEEAKEPVVTATSLRAYLTAKHPNKPAKVEEKLAAVYTPSVRVEFGSRS
jgi:hypothetical protein